VTGQKLIKTCLGKKKVFCIRTENKSFVMRQGDCITITGNCLYGAGSLKAGTIIDPNEKDEVVLRKLGSTAINSFMDGVPALKKLKYQIEETIASRGYLRGVDGRVLYCRSAFKGLNVLLQASGAAIMKQVVVNVHENIESNLGLVHGRDWEQLLFIHDEIEIACQPVHTESIKTQALKSFEEAGRFFNFRCPIEGDAKVGKTWYDVH
jgi:DNA polymerase I-like protein with 3'-5' exonuclease and polymerase domains